jgi:hypothetical protein
LEARRGRRIPLRKTPILLAAILSSLVVLAVYGGFQQASGEQVSSEAGGRAVARAGDVVAIGGRIADGVRGGAVARAGDVVARGADVVIGERGRRGDAREARLEIEGHRGTRFSGTCTVGKREREIDGKVPERFVYDLDGRRLECEIRKQSTGAMSIVLAVGNTDHVQQTVSRRATVRIVYSKQGFSSSIQSSSISSSSTSQTLSSSSSSVISSSMSSR